MTNVINIDNDGGLHQGSGERGVRGRQGLLWRGTEATGSGMTWFKVK